MPNTNINEDDAQIPNDIHEHWQADVDDYSFFGQNWQDYAPYPEEREVPSTRGRPGQYEDETVTVFVDPLDTIEDDMVRNSITSLRAWGQGPILAAMKGLGIFEVNDQETADQVVSWLGENYNNIFDGVYDFSDLPTIDEEKLNYTPVEMDLTYEPKYPESEKTIRKAFGGMAYAGKPQPISLQDYSEVVETNSLYDL